MTELKPCPFCGADEEDILVYDYHLPFSPKKGVVAVHLIYCSKCGGAMIDEDMDHAWKDRAEAWNRRVPNGSDQ